MEHLMDKLVFLIVVIVVVSSAIKNALRGLRKPAQGQGEAQTSQEKSIERQLADLLGRGLNTEDEADDSSPAPTVAPWNRKLEMESESESTPRPARREEDRPVRTFEPLMRPEPARPVAVSRPIQAMPLLPPAPPIEPAKPAAPRKRLQQVETGAAQARKRAVRTGLRPRGSGLCIGPRALARAFILSEIVRPPLALRDARDPR